MVAVVLIIEFHSQDVKIYLRLYKNITPIKTQSQLIHTAGDRGAVGPEQRPRAVRRGGGARAHRGRAAAAARALHRAARRASIG